MRPVLLCMGMLLLAWCGMASRVQLRRKGYHQSFASIQARGREGGSSYAHEEEEQERGDSMLFGSLRYTHEYYAVIAVGGQQFTVQVGM